ncbi:MAG TPA: hypothetical protein GX708_16965 [Gallicola sp.]|nr:hypothetical protein [Gallicola sp.]
MNNNRKQKVFSFLDSVTETELNNYIKERKINNISRDALNKIKNNSQKSHWEQICFSLMQKTNENSNNFLKLGQAFIIAFVLECFYDKKYKIKDLKEYLKVMIDNDEELKNYVYDCMKDF